MIKRRHRYFLSGLALFEVTMTGLLYRLYDVYICGPNVTGVSLTVAQGTFAFFTATLWGLLCVIVYYAKNDVTESPRPI